MGSGPPSGAGTLGAAAATYVLTRAASSNIALVARFIGFSPCAKSRTRRCGFSRARIIQSLVKPPTYFYVFCP